MNAVIYARYSSAGQRDQSIEDQITACQKYADAHNLTVVDIYADHAKTGRNDNRAEFQRMLRESAAGAFDLVLLWKLDRFGRNREEMTMNRIKLKKNNVKVVSVMENIPETSEGVILEALMEGLAEYYSLNLSENVKRGMESNAQKGLYNGGQIPFGYKVENQTFVPDEDEAPIIKMIFDWFVKGYSRPMIRDRLENAGIVNRRGNKFSLTSITSMLKNRRYIGEYKFNDTVIKDHFEPLVDKKVFDQAQELLADQAVQRRSLKNCRYMLSGIIKCAHCGKNYVAEAGTSRSGKVYKYYACSGKKLKHNGCKNRNLKKEELETLVLDITLKKILKDQKVVRAVAENFVRSAEAANDSQEIIQSLESKLKESKKRRSNLLDAIEQGIVTDTTLSRLKELENEVAEIEGKLAVEKTKKPLPTVEAVEWYLSDLSSASIKEEADRQRLINILIKKVVVDDRLITVIYNPFNKYKKNTLKKCSNITKMAGQEVPKLNTIILFPDGCFAYKFLYDLAF